MKKIAFVLLASAFLASCTNSTEKTETPTTDSTAVVTDTSVSTTTVTAVDSTKN